jgi:hypothetical protein
MVVSQVAGNIACWLLVNLSVNAVVQGPGVPGGFTGLLGGEGVAAQLQQQEEAYSTVRHKGTDRDTR